MNEHAIIESVKKWLDSFVIQLNLCPFAKAEVVKNRVRYSVCHATNEGQLLHHLEAELHYIETHLEVETTLLIHPNVLQDFLDYNDFLDQADALIESLDLQGLLQIASFHPNYQFSETRIEDAENYSNKSPYPLLHILRESSIEKAINNYPNSQNIPLKNIDTLRKMGSKSCKEKWLKCFIKL